MGHGYDRRKEQDTNDERLVLLRQKLICDRRNSNKQARGNPSAHFESGGKEQSYVADQSRKNNEK